MLKIRRSRDRLIFNMGIPYLGRTVFILKRGPAAYQGRTWHAMIAYTTVYSLAMRWCPHCLQIIKRVYDNRAMPLLKYLYVCISMYNISLIDSMHFFHGYIFHEYIRLYRFTNDSYSATICRVIPSITLTHYGREKITAILPITHSNAYFLMKLFIFDIFFINDQLMIMPRSRKCNKPLSKQMRV